LWGFCKVEHQSSLLYANNFVKLIAMYFNCLADGYVFSSLNVHTYMQTIFQKIKNEPANKLLLKSNKNIKYIELETKNP